MSRYRTFAPIDAIRKITVVRNSNSLVSLVNSLIESNSCSKSYIYIYISMKNNILRKVDIYFTELFSFPNEIECVHRPYTSRKASFH